MLIPTLYISLDFAALSAHVHLRSNDHGTRKKHTPKRHASFDPIHPVLLLDERPTPAFGRAQSPTVRM